MTADRGLVAGKRYRIWIQDCCVEAVLEGEFLRTEPSTDGSMDVYSAVFSFGWIDIGGFSFEEIS